METLIATNESDTLNKLIDTKPSKVKAEDKSLNGGSAKMILPGTEWSTLLTQVRSLLPEAFEKGHVLNLVGGEWKLPGHGKHYLSPVDGSELGFYPMIGLEEARDAVHFSSREFHEWSFVDLDERKGRVSEVLDELRRHQELLARLLVWEIGKPLAQSRVSVERCIDGVQWYVENIERMQGTRDPLGVISNIASWNYPMSVLVHAVLVQALCGNSVIAKTPSDGGLYALTLSFAIMRRAGLPVSLLSGSGGQLSEALVRNDDIACLSFVGGKTNGRDIAVSLYDKGKRYMLEMEGVNAYGVWNFSDWDNLAGQIKKGFEYGKQRCTAYARWVVQRELLPEFLEMYLPVMNSLRFGHPLLVNSPEGAAPDVDFGPLINAKKTEELRVMYSEALGGGAVPIFEGRFDEAIFFPDQDISAYMPPMSLLNIPKNCRLYHNEPFGPMDSVIVVDRVEELINEMNVSNGSLVASLACDDWAQSNKIAEEVRAFKVGINKVRSRGDKEEVFGGIGQSWKGCFAGGKYLVDAVTNGEPNEKLYGNFADTKLLPEER